MLDTFLVMALAAGAAGIPAAGEPPDAAPAQSSAPSPRGGETLTLDQALAIALGESRLVKNAQLDVGKSDDALAATKTNRLPVLSVNLLQSRQLIAPEFTFDKGAFGTFRGVGPIPAEDTTLDTNSLNSTLGLATVSQPLSQLYKVGLGVHIKDLDRAISAEKLRAQRQSIASDVKSAYFGILQAQSGLAAAERSLEFYDALKEQIAHDVAQQTALDADLLDVRARRAQQEYDTIVLRHGIVSQKERLNQLLGRDVRTPFEVVPAEADADLPLDEDAACRRAIERRPELREARLAQEQAELDRRLKKAEWIPDLSLSLSYVRLFDEQVLPTNIASAGLLFKWDVYDWGKKRRELAEKTKTAEQASNGIREAESAVLVEVGARYRAAEEARSFLEAARAGREAARERLRIVTNRYGQQAALLKDLLEAQAKAASLEAQVQQALSSYGSARALLDKAVGEDP